MYGRTNVPFGKKFVPIFTGTYEFFGNAKGDWSLWLESDGDLTLNYKKPVDIFIVGAGNTGTHGSGNSSINAINNAPGGNGGECKTITNVVIPKAMQSCKINTNESTKLGDLYSAEKGAGALGGQGSEVYGDSGRHPSPGEDGSLAFTDGIDKGSVSSGKKFGAGGGGGGGNTNRYWSDGGANGGTDGGGHGAGTGGSSGQAGSFYGAGGGGGGYSYNGASFVSTSGGAGYKGIIIIRNHR